MPTLTITKSYADTQVLTEADLDNIKDDIESFLNVTGLDDDNLQNAGITASSKLVDGSITAAKIGTSAVTTAKINDDAVTTAKIADSAVTAAKLATAAINTVVPAGAILPYGGTSDPTGYLLCDGRAVSRTTYATLYAAIADAFGEGDGSTTFNLPDFRGRFLRGTDDMGTAQGAASRDPDRASRTAMNTGGNTGNNVGSVQDDATAKNGLALTDPGHVHDVNGTGGISFLAGSNSTGYLPDAGDVSGIVKSNTTGITLGNGDNETRPLNAYVNYIIKT